MSAWVFKPMACTRCGGAHALSECKWPLVKEKEKSNAK